MRHFAFAAGGLLAAIVAAPALVLPGVAAAQELTVWHDLGDNGTQFFTKLGAEFAKTHPGVTIKPVNYPTDQWFGRVIGALNTDSAPDLIFNNYERVIRIETQTGKVGDLKAVLAQVQEKDFLGEDDLRVATYSGKMIILPVQRVQMALGVRKSWLDKTGESFPKTWGDVQRIAVKFKADDPDGNGKADTYAMALEAAKPRDLIHILDLFTFGSGLRHTLVDPQGEIVIDEPQHAKVLAEFIKTYTTYGYVAPDTINHSFAEMYQVIEGGRAGMFRVGDWNVKKWDAQALKGDYVVGPWPQFSPDRESAVVIGGMRGVAVPENSPHKDLAIAFAQFMLTKPAQQISLETIGAGVRKDLDTSALSDRGRFFAEAKGKLVAYDFPESVHAWYPELEAAFHRKLMGALASPPADVDAFIKETAAEMRALKAKLATKG
jgi:ABC-type glycerol-3-phosphate transport system substrate-binding protein